MSAITLRTARTNENIHRLSPSAGPSRELNGNTILQTSAVEMTGDDTAAARTPPVPRPALPRGSASGVVARYRGRGSQTIAKHRSVPPGCSYQGQAPPARRVRSRRRRENATDLVATGQSAGETSAVTRLRTGATHQCWSGGKTGGSDASDPPTRATVVTPAIPSHIKRLLSRLI